MSDRDVIAETILTHGLEAAAGWKEGTLGFRSWCDCGWHSIDQLPESEVQFGVRSEVGVRWHAEHVADAIATTLDALPDNVAATDGDHVTRTVTGDATDWLLTCTIHRKGQASQVIGDTE